VRPGVFEVPNGLPLGDLIYKHAGGLRDGMRLKAVATSGPSAGFLPARIPTKILPKSARDRLGDATTFSLLDIPLDLQAFRDFGLMLGAGLVVYGDRTDMMDQAVNATEFFRNESCGKCVPCRIGCQKLVEIGQSLRNGRYEAEGPEAVEGMVNDLRRAMEMASICGLGMVGANPIGSVLQLFRDDVDAYAPTHGKPMVTSIGAGPKSQNGERRR
jgi:NADH:ubiquinone oxidoreductase subunit F (NADH-binding)